MKKLFLFLFVVSASMASAKGDPIKKCLTKKIDAIASIKDLGPRSGFQNVYDIRLTQPVDHNDASQGTFEQRIYLYHKDRKKPVIFVTEGYTMRDRKYELCDILDANQISVEYRYFGESVPKNADWEHLNNTQAAADLHTIRELFGKIYKKEWISTGISKGGTTTMIYKALFPDDVDASVNYVGPLTLQQEDRRMDDHILSVGSNECRKALHFFQIEALKRRLPMIKKIDSLAAADNLSFAIGTGAALEFAVLEYTFSFWQYAHDCSEVPSTDASDHEIFNSLVNMVGFDFYSDATYEYYKPAFYQFVTENGYYGFIHDHVKHLLVDLDYPSNVSFAPRELDIKFDGTLMNMVNEKLRAVGDKMIHVHGEYDPWGAVGFFPEESQDALLLIKPQGGHTTRIKDLSPEQQQMAYDKLDEWLKAKVTPIGASAP